MSSGNEQKLLFTVRGCGADAPNKRISAKYPEIEFAKVDVDELNDTTSKAGVRVSVLRLIYSSLSSPMV